ncbi:response regulator [Solimonas soli]|uniref:response regulator n=1 Tax=Solimonas soli TaxID=413479 RepID=UPI000485E267|nr:response regulator [Solimonas soli]
MRILLVEDDRLIADTLVTALGRGGHVVDRAQTLREAEAALDGEYALVLLDLGLPDGDGLQLLRDVRARRDPLPVIALTARDRATDRALGLDLGADDYVIKPFEMVELEARIRAVTRRAGAGAAAELRVGDLALRREQRSALIADQALELTPREYALLELLLMRQGRVVSKAQIEQQLCSWDESLSDAAIEVLVHRLRRKLGAARGVTLATLRGFGYLLSGEDA